MSRRQVQISEVLHSSVPDLYVTMNGVKCCCRRALALLAGCFEEDAIEQTFGRPMCELDCEDCGLSG